MALYCSGAQHLLGLVWAATEISESSRPHAVHRHGTVRPVARDRTFHCAGPRHHHGTPGLPATVSVRRVKIRDVEKFGIFAAWVGVCALFLAVPMSIAANLLTPKVQRWWATTTASRARSRLEELRKKKADIEEEKKDPWLLASRIMQPLVDFINFGIVSIIFAILVAMGFIVLMLNPKTPNDLAIRVMVYIAGGFLLLCTIPLTAWNLGVTVDRVSRLSTKATNAEISKLVELLERFPSRQIGE